MLQEKQVLVEDHLYLVKNIVKASFYINESVEGLGYEDLYQTGCMALCHAALRYQADQGASFKTFATLVIRNQLYSYCRKINRRQAGLEYLDAPLKASPGLTYADILTDEDRQQKDSSLTDALAMLSDAQKVYTGISQKGVEALKLRCMGYGNLEIARHYGVKPNHVAAWISRAGSKLRANEHFACLQQS